MFTDRVGNEVAESKAFGLKQSIKITHKYAVFFADECGFLTSMKKDGNIAGTKFVVERGTIPQMRACTNDHRFTLLPVTSASGNAVCCIVIFQSELEEVPIHWQSGIDITVEPVKGADGKIDAKLNLGEGKYYPGGPKCSYNGKVMDCLTFCSPSGGITGAILVEILKYFDKVELCPRVSGGPIPVLIVDGHQSRLDPGLVSYINGEGHKWKVCLGVPYATTIWQVGDASEQNGNSKAEWYREKKIFLEWKYDHDLPSSINPTDIIPLLNKMFHRAYNNKAANKKAVCDRGWFPPNCVLINHPALMDDITPKPTPTVDDLNTSEGMGATVLNRVICNRARQDGARKAAEERKRKGETVIENLRESKRLSSGVLAANGVYSLNDERFLQAYNEKQAETAAAAAKSAESRRTRLRKKISGVKALRDKYGHESTHLFATLSKTECGTYLQYKKQSTKDGKMPVDLEARRQRCIEWMSRPSPTASPSASDCEDDSVGEGDMAGEDLDAAAVVEGLLGLGDNRECGMEEMEDIDGHFGSLV